MAKQYNMRYTIKMLRTSTYSIMPNATLVEGVTYLSGHWQVRKLHCERVKLEHATGVADVPVHVTGSVHTQRCSNKIGSNSTSTSMARGIARQVQSPSRTDANQAPGLSLSTVKMTASKESLLGSACECTATQVRGGAPWGVGGGRG